uniref:CCHC-type domain-containing protein n=1 Tax=Tanacetum cinerariifolium TaxID=118510 RepID=A0A6L2JYT0_TANCI|nr:hypothetical protein [Tanacetum cinerariifolium]
MPNPEDITDPIGVQNVGSQNGVIVVSGIANQNGNGNVVAAQTEGNAHGNNSNQIRCYNCRGLGHLARNCTIRPRRRNAAYLQTQLLIANKEEARIQIQAEEFDLMVAAADLDEIKKVNANCILMANLQQASTSGTQSDKDPVYDSDGSAEYTELLERIPEPHQVLQNNSNVTSTVSSVEQGGGTVEQHPTNVEEACVLYEKVNSVNQATKFVRDFQSLAKEADESLSKHKALELEIEHLLRAVVSQDIMSIMQNNSIVDTSNLQTELERTKEHFENCIIKKENVNDHVAAILGFSDLQWGNILIIRVYFVEGLGHNLFLVGQFCDSDLEATSTKSWLWHQRLSHLNFDTINDLARNNLVTSLQKFIYHKEHLCPLCEQGKRKRTYHPPKLVPNSRQRLHLLHMDLCGPMRIESINGKRYVLVIMDDYSRYTWVIFLRSKDEAPEEIKTFLTKTIVLLQAQSLLVYSRRTKKIKETMNVTFDELSAMAFEQSNLKPGLQSMTSEQISSGLNLTYAPSTTTTQQPTEGELDLLFEAMYDDHIDVSTAPRTVLAAQTPQVLQTSTTTTTTTDTTPTPTNSSSQATSIPSTLQNVNELKTQQQHVQHQPATIVDNVPNAMLDDNSFVNPFATTSTSAAESSSS